MSLCESVSVCVSVWIISISIACKVVLYFDDDEDARKK